MSRYYIVKKKSKRTQSIELCWIPDFIFREGGVIIACRNTLFTLIKGEDFPLSLTNKFFLVKETFFKILSKRQ